MPAQRPHPSSQFKISSNFNVGGDGPVKLTFKRHANGNAEVSLGIDYSKAAPPELSYVADHFELSEGRSTFSLRFGKLTADEASLRTRVEIIFPKGMFQQQLIRSTRDFLRSVPVPVQGTSESVAMPDPEKMQIFKSNNVMLAAWSDEAVADFYFVSPSEFAHAARQLVSDVRLVPSIRVTMDLPLLKEFLEKCHALDTNADGDTSGVENEHAD